MEDRRRAAARPAAGAASTPSPGAASTPALDADTTPAAGPDGSSGPRVHIVAAEYPHEGRAVLSFQARPAPDGAPVAFVEYRLGQGAWRRGDSVEVRRRGIVSRVICRAVDVAGVAGPEQVWEKDWPGLCAVAYPEGSEHWFATYDWWRFRHHDRWWLDHPVCLLFRSATPERDLVPRIEHTLRRLGMRSHFFDWALLLGRASDGGLSVSCGEPPDVYRPTVFSKGLKRRLSGRSLPGTLLQAAGSLDSGGLQSSLHVRVYAPEGGCFFDRDFGSWAVGTCHLDVNELTAVRDGRLHWGAALPSGAPDPGVGADLIKYGGHSDRAAELVAELWQRAFGPRCVTRGAVRLGDPQEWFEVQRSGTWRGRSWVMGKWWHNDGRLTLLDLPTA